MAAPSRNNQQNTRSEANASSYTLASYTPSSGAGQLLVVRAAILRTAATATTMNVTFGGVAMTEAVTVADTSSNRYYRQSIYYLATPGTSAADIVVTPSVTVQGCIIDAVTLLGVNIAAPVGVTATDSDTSGTDTTLTLTGCAADSMIIAAVTSTSAAAPSWTWATATEDYDLAGANDTAEIAGSGGYYATPSAGNYTLTPTRSANAPRFLGAAAEFKSFPPSPQTVAIATGNDDAYQSNTGAVTLTNTSVNVNTTDSPYVILVFRDLPIPAGATLTSNTKLEVYCSTYDDPGLTIKAEASVSPATPAATSNNISGRTTGSSSVTWSASNLGTSGYVASPSIASVVQEWLGLSGYTQGASDLALILNTTGSGHIRFFARDSGSNYPRLVLEWTTGGGTTYEATAADVLEGTEGTARRGVYRTTAAEILDLAAAPTPRRVLRPVASEALGLASSLSRRGVLRPVVAETLAMLAALTPRRVLQATATEVLGLASGMGGKGTRRPSLVDLLDLLDAAAGGGLIPVAAADTLDIAGSVAPGWKLRRVAGDTWELTPAAGRVTTFRPTVADGWTMAGAAAYPLPSGAGELHVAPDSDAREELLTGAVLDFPGAAIINQETTYALKIDDLDIPAGAVIDAADLEVYITGSDDPGLTIRAEASIAPAEFMPGFETFDISTRTLTTAAAPWTAANVGTFQYVTTPDFAAVVQEVIDLPGWTVGDNGLVIVFTNTAPGSELYFLGLTGDYPPTFNIYWHTGNLPIQADSADMIALLEDAERGAIIHAATADATAWSSAATAALTLLLAEDWQLSEAVLSLARLTVADAALLGGNVYLTYALSLTEPLILQVALQRIAQARAATVDAVDYAEAVRTMVKTAAGDALELTDALAARRILATLLQDRLAYSLFQQGNIFGLLDAIAQDAIDWGEALSAGWRSRATVADGLKWTAALAAMRRFVAAANDAGLLGEVAAAVRRLRPTATDAAELAEALRARLGTRAVDEWQLDAAAVAQALTLLRVIAADGLALSEGARVAWRVTARDTLEFAAALAAVMHWVETVGDALAVRDVVIHLLPNGIVRIEFAIMGASVAFEIAMPRADMALNQPRVDIEPHGLIER